MLRWGPTLASVGVAVRRVKAGEQSRCVVALAVSYKRQTGSRCYDHPVPGHSDYCFRRSQTYVCVIEHFGAYQCPTNAEGSRPLRNQNAMVDRRGALTLQVSLGGTRATPPLAWQRYPHVDGFVEPWAAGGTLRPGLRFKGEGRGGCVVVDETALIHALDKGVIAGAGLDVYAEEPSVPRSLTTNSSNIRPMSATAC